MFKHDPIITYNHMQEEAKRSHTFNTNKNKWEMFLFVAETGLILLVLVSMILLMF